MFVNADLPAFVYPIKAITGWDLYDFFLFCFSYLSFSEAVFNYSKSFASLVFKLYYSRLNYVSPTPPNEPRPADPFPDFISTSTV